MRERWDETYQILHPLAKRSVEELQQEFRQAIFQAWLIWHGETTEEQLDSLVTNEEFMVLRALEESCELGWRDALLGQMLAKHGYATYGSFTGPQGLWGAAVSSTTERGFHRPGPPEPWSGSEFPIRLPLREALFRVYNKYTFSLNSIRGADQAVVAVPAGEQSFSDRVREIITVLCHNAWHEEVEINNRCGWDDAKWWQYLDLEDRLSWTAIALGLPGENPEKYGYLVDEIAFKTVKDSIEEWTWQAIPENFISELGNACLKLASLPLTNDEKTKQYAAPATKQTK
jgi:hypothetical protein